MSSRTRGRTARGWDIGLGAAILAVVLLGWLTAPGGNGAPASHSGQPVVPARLSSRAGPGGNAGSAVSVAARPRGGNRGAVSVAARPRGGNWGAAARGRSTRR
jgi:hypothetical protein